MELQGRILSTNMTGDDVALLHIELRKMGFQLQTTEIKKQRFGRATGEVVRALQTRHNLPVSGKVDEGTVAVINREVQALEKQPFVIQGSVKSSNNKPLSAVVRAFDKDLRAMQPLGDARTDAKGQFRIEYSTEHFRRAEKINADLIVQAFDSKERLIATSEIFFNAPPEVRIELIGKPSVDEKLSEFESIMLELQPLLDGVALVELSSDDVAFLVGETGLERERLIMLVHAALLGLEVIIPTEVFYGLARMGLKLELDKLLQEKIGLIRKTLLTAIKKAIIPAALADSLDKIIERWGRLPFEHGLEVAHELFVELLDEQSKTPLANYDVNAFDLDTPEEPSDLGAAVTDDRGRFAVSYFTPKVKTTEDDVAPVADRRMRLVVSSPEDAPQVAVEIIIEVGNREIIPVLVAIPAASDDSPTLVALKRRLRVPGIDALISNLADKNINSLEDIRSCGGISELSDLPVSVNDPAVQLLEAHANLNVLSNDVDLNQKLIDNGLSSVASIAGRPRSDFVSLIDTLKNDLASPVDDLSAARLHAEAKAGTHFLNNVVMGLAADVANGIDSPMAKALPLLTKKFAARCACYNCESAVSPLAYLSDLLDYATTHLKREVHGAIQTFTMQALDNQFHQSFGEFSIDCDLVEEKMPQVRLCVEVLRSFTESPLVNELPGEAEYRFTAYRALLAVLGTSHEELRATRSENEAARIRFSDRLGIAVEHLNEFPIELSAVTEILLERLFGLPDTTRDVLSKGAKFEDSRDQLKRWSLLGAEWNRNTDDVGLVYLTLSQPDLLEDRFVIEVFRNPEHTQLVASGERIGASGQVVIAPQNGSQLAGTVEIEFSENDSMALSLVPLVLSRRYSFLRDQWLHQDHPNAEVPATGRYPLIDPDLVSPADLKSPKPADSAFQLWQARRQQLEGFLTEIKGKRQIDNLGNINIGDTIESELGVSIANLEELRSQFAEGEDDAINNIQVVGLEPAGLNRLLALLELLQNNGDLLEQELNEFDSILVQARKVMLFDDWRNEESLSLITLSPDHFRITSEEPEELLLWRATRSQRRDWLRRLKGRIEQEQAAREQVYEAIGKAEQAGLLILRDSLLLAPQVKGESLESKATWVTHNLLIDAHTDICMRTTRVAQAIETLQALIESARRGTAFDELSTLSLNPDNFDEEWKWLGTYETWRSAMLLFLYPENLLLPSLRTKQTPGFKQLVKNVRSQRRLTPEQACNAAYHYAQYFGDICSLKVETSCRAKTLIHKDDPCRGRVPVTEKSLDYFFGRGNETQTVYWSSYEPKGQCGQEQSYWAPVPNLENVEVVIGAVPYRVTLSESYICLFVQVRENDRQKLKLIRYRLEHQRWDEEPQTLDLPERNDRKPTRFSAVASQRGRDSAAPHLAVFVWNTIYDRRLNLDATGWDESPGRHEEAELHGDWGILAPSAIGRKFERVWSMVDLDGENYYLLVKNRSGELHYRLVGPKDDGFWHPQLIEINSWRGEPVGAFGLGTKKIYAFWKAKRIQGVALFSFPGVIPEFNPEVTFYRTITTNQEGFMEIATIAAFVDWLDKVTGLSLGMINLDFDGRTYNMKDLLTQDHPRRKHLFSEAIKFIGEQAQNGNLGIGWRWADFMVRKMSRNHDSLGDVLFKLVGDAVHKVSVRSFDFKQRKDTLSAPQQTMSGLDHIAPAFMLPVSSNQIVIGTQFADTGVFRTVFKSQNNDSLIAPELTRLTPLCSGPFDITEQLSGADRTIRAHLIKQTFNDNTNGPRSHRTYLEEAYYFVPVFLALQLSRRGQFESALDWFRTVYDYTLPEENSRKIYYGLILEQTLAENYQRASDWLENPLDPHAIAATRASSYTRFTQLSIVQCLLDFADAEFTRDSAESVARARTLYLTALGLLDTANLGRTTAECQAKIDSLDAEISGMTTGNDPQWLPLWKEAKAKLGQVGYRAALETTISAVRTAITARDDFAPRMIAILDIVSNTAVKIQPTLKLSNLVSGREQQNANVYRSGLSIHEIKAGFGQIKYCAGNNLVKGVETVVGVSAKSLVNRALSFLREPAVFTPTEVLEELPGIDLRRPLVALGEFFVESSPFNPLVPPPAKHRADAFKRAPHAAIKLTSSASLGFIPNLNREFCVPQNPIPYALRLHAQLNLFKIRNCRNIAGDERAFEPYSAPVDVTTGLPSIGSGREIVIPRRLNLPPTPYRYSVLVDRAKQLVSLAQQMEAAFLSALEKRDAEFYNLMRARQEVRLARSGVRLQDLRVKEAGDGVKLTELQRERAEIQEDNFQDLLSLGWSSQEQGALALMAGAAALHAIAGSSGGFSLKALFENGAGAISSFATALSTTASILQTRASYERREQEWRFQKNLAEQDIRIGSQQIKLAKDRVRIVGQERTIAEIQTEHANQSVEFLANKFTNTELYEFMSEVLEGVYSYFLQQATSVARLAERQLAFERQQVPPPMIQVDYWEAPQSFNDNASIGGEAPDRRGITGSARLLQDITRLDQFAFQTDDRKLQLTKTLSLARLAPAEFQRFRESGVLLFNTPMTHFDQDFPGHYLRLIKRVRTSVIALIPPTEGIKSTLMTNGISRLVIDAAGSFQTVDTHRAPESVALSSPRDATGLFELLPQSQEKLFPFEGMGVDTTWELQLPKAANFFDYSTLLDVMITIEYTALNSVDYRRQVINQLDQSISADRAFSFRNEFADQWYELHNPEQTNTPMVVSITTRREDFPPNIDELKIQHIVLFFSLANGVKFEIPITSLSFKHEDPDSPIIEGIGATTVQSVVSTRRANGGNWTDILRDAPDPFGTWTLSLLDELIPGGTFMPDLTPASAFKEEKIEDVLFVITYSGQTSEWPA